MNCSTFQKSEARALAWNLGVPHIRVPWICRVLERVLANLLKQPENESAKRPEHSDPEDWLRGLLNLAGFDAELYGHILLLSVSTLLGQIPTRTAAAGRKAHIDSDKDADVNIDIPLDIDINLNIGIDKHTNRDIAMDLDMDIARDLGIHAKAKALHNM